MDKKFFLALALGAVMLQGCNTGQRVSLAERRQQTGIRLPFRAEKQDSAFRTSAPQSVTWRDASGQENTVVMAERDSVTGQYEVIGGQIGEVTVTALSKSVAERNGRVSLDFVVVVPKDLMQKDWRLVVLPTLDNGGELTVLDSLEITGSRHYDYNVRLQRQAKRQAKVSHSDAAGRADKRRSRLQRRRDWSEWTDFDSYRTKGEQVPDEYAGWGVMDATDGAVRNDAVDLYTGGLRLDTVMDRHDDYVYFYSQQVRSEDMATHLRVWFDSYIVNCGDERYPLLQSDTVSFFISSFLQFLDHTPRYVRKTVQRRVTDRMAANIQFRVGDAALIDTLGGNAAELSGVRSRLAQIDAGNEFIIDSVSITAYASPEGSVQSNKALAQKRAQAIKHWLTASDSRNLLPDDDGIRARAQAEDWTRLRELVRQCPYIGNADAIIRLIDTVADRDLCEQKIRSLYPRDYQYMRDEMYPQLRAVDFVFHLARRGMVEDVMFTDEIDTQYAEALRLMKARRYKQAMSKLLEYQDWNCALCYMSLGYNRTALKMFEAMPESADREYLRAILYAREGDTEKAVQLYLRSCELDDTKIMRGELDPEIADIIKAYNLHATEFNAF